MRVSRQAASHDFHVLFSPLYFNLLMWHFTGVVLEVTLIIQATLNV